MQMWDTSYIALGLAIVALLLFAATWWVDLVHRKYAADVANAITADYAKISNGASTVPGTIPAPPAIATPFVAGAALIFLGLSIFTKGLVDTSTASATFKSGVCATAACKLSVPRQAVSGSSAIATLEIPSGTSVFKEFYYDGQAVPSVPYVTSGDSKTRLYNIAFTVKDGQHTFTAFVGAAGKSFVSGKLKISPATPSDAKVYPIGDCGQFKLPDATKGQLYYLDVTIKATCQDVPDPTVVVNGSVVTPVLTGLDDADDKTGSVLDRYVIPAATLQGDVGEVDVALANVNEVVSLPVEGRTELSVASVNAWLTNLWAPLVTLIGLLNIIWQAFRGQNPGTGIAQIREMLVFSRLARREQ